MTEISDFIVKNGIEVYRVVGSDGFEYRKGKKSVRVSGNDILTSNSAAKMILEKLKELV